MQFYGMLGEKLGSIGKSKEQGEENEQHDMPQWKRDFLQKPSISVRNGIARVRRQPPTCWNCRI